MAKYHCIVCRKPFFGGESKKRVHCSIACRSVTNTFPRREKTCENCGTVFSFLPRKVDPRFCSRKCYEAGRAIPIAVRFWPKVALAGPKECWSWKGSIDARGYGKFGIRGKIPQPAHRISYEIAYGPIPKGKQINHKCDVRACVNPTHLYAGTAKQNTHDAIERSRLACGEKHGRVKLTLSQVIEIRKRFDNGETNAVLLANDYGIGDTQVRRIMRGQRWQRAISQRA